MSHSAGDVFIELIQLLPKKVQWVIAVLIAAALGFFAYFAYLYFTGGLW